MIAYEVNGSENLLGYFPNDPNNNAHFITDQLMAVRIYDGDNGGVKAEVRDWIVARPESEAGVRDESTDYFEFNSPSDYGFPDYRFVGVSGNPADGKTYFFTDNGTADPNTPSDAKTTVMIDPGDMIEFQFYEASNCGPGGNESCWNNATSANTDFLPPPDAYYGSFDLILNPAAASELRVTPDDTLTLPNARAGDPTATTDSIQVENVGGGVITGEFAALTGDTTEIGPSGTQSFSLAASGSATDQRDYTFDASGVIFDVSDAGSTGKSFTVTQDITSDADLSPDQTRTVQATAKSPILGVSNVASPDTSGSADWLAYGSTIDLGTLDVGDDFLVADLILGNLFGVDEGDMTDLTLYSVSIPALSNPNGLFEIESGEVSGTEETIVATDTRFPAVRIRFDPDDTDIGTWTAQLDFVTDMYRAHDVGEPNASTLSFTLQATLREAPAPGAVALIGIGLVPLLAARRLASATSGR